MAMQQLIRNIAIPKRNPERGGSVNEYQATNNSDASNHATTIAETSKTIMNTVCMEITMHRNLQ